MDNTTASFPTEYHLRLDAHAARQQRAQDAEAAHQAAVSAALEAYAREMGLA
jgi:hypothetical protein